MSKSTFSDQIQEVVLHDLQARYSLEIDSSKLIINETKKEFEGDYTLVIFPLVKQLKKKPEELGDEIGTILKEELDFVVDYNVIKGFVNLSFSDDYWKAKLMEISALEKYGIRDKNGEKVLVEFSSPNTNKPLHMGHIRNILLGWSMSRIFEAQGYDVVKTQIVNDRGIAVCKSMLAWQKFGDGATPDSTGIKGDHFVGKYYVDFDKRFRAEYDEWASSDKGQQAFQELKKGEEEKEGFFKRYKNQYFNDHSALGIEAKEMLQKWEANDTETVDLWKKMNSWVYSGFNATYDKLEVSFDCLYHESETYLLGKENIESGLGNGVFYKKDDASIWVDLEDVGMDHKLVLRSDGTSVYMTQDIGTAAKRYEDHGTKRMIYVVGDEQDYHFKALFEILKKLNEPYADGLYHLSYGMIDLPTGRMKSREGTVVDADDLVAEVIQEAKLSAEEHSDLGEMDEESKMGLYRRVGMAALKYFILKVQAKKRMVFNPKESVDMQGQTGPYIQNAYVRIASIFRKDEGDTGTFEDYKPVSIEKKILRELSKYPDTIDLAAKQYDPSVLANYGYDLAKLFHRFYHDVRILGAESPEAKSFRLSLSKSVARVLKHSMYLLGIDMPEKM